VTADQAIIFAILLALVVLLVWGPLALRRGGFRQPDRRVGADHPAGLAAVAAQALPP